jgi:hypothetical protein
MDGFSQTETCAVLSEVNATGRPGGRAAGHRIPVTVTTTDFPHLLPTPQQLARLFGGSYEVQRTATAPSSITVPLTR